jgi:hypothetical protein
MVALLCFSLVLLASPAENAALRHQLMVLQRKVRGRVHFTNSDRLFFIHLYRWFPSVLKAMMIIRPETLVRWHHAGLCRYWRWKSRSAGGPPGFPKGGVSGTLPQKNATAKGLHSNQHLGAEGVSWRVAGDFWACYIRRQARRQLAENLRSDAAQVGRNVARIL